MAGYRTEWACDTLVLNVYTFATLPSTASEGMVALISDADTTTGTATLVVYDGSNWIDMVDGTAAAAD